MSVPLAIVFLSAHLDDLAHSPCADEAWEELSHATAALERMVDRRAAARFAGKCAICGTDLYAGTEAVTVECRPCGVTFEMEKMRADMLDQLADRLVRASEAAHILPGLGTIVSRQDISNWDARGLLMAHGTDEKGRPLYRVSEVLTVANRPRKTTRRKVG